MAARRDPRVAIATQYQAEARRTRRPQLRFNLKTLPYQLQPFVCHPVLPGETISDIMLQTQVWSDPLVGADMKNIGWWNQYNFFYVKHRDLPDPIRSDLAKMMLEPDHDLTAYHSAGNLKTYTAAGAVDWAMECLKHVTEEYFRDEGESWDHATHEGLPLAKVWGKGSSDAFDKLTLDADYEDRRVKLNDANGDVYVDEMGKKWAHWAAMRDAGLIQMDYEDFMRTYGSVIREDEESPNLHRAEDLWSLREFTYPTNTVEPTTGVPATAVGWRVQSKGGKRTFAQEPGFLLGVTYCRPKVYMGAQAGSVAGFLTHVLDWLPPVVHDENDASHKQFPGEAGPLPDIEDPYWIDIRDLLIHGDQFVNYAITENSRPFVDLPAATGDRRYAATAEITQFFAEEGGCFTHDGICTPSILGRQSERTKNLVLGQQ